MRYFKPKTMTKTLLIIGILITNFCYSQNEYQSQLYLLNERINKFEKKYLALNEIDSHFGETKLDLIKDLHRLGEEASSAGIEKDINTELGQLISDTTEFGCMKLNLLESYLGYHKEIYKENLNRTKTIFLSLYLKVKALE